jgi:hypothetical protein
MGTDRGGAWDRREFIVAAGAVAGIGISAGAAGRGVAIVTDPGDRVASSPAAQWAAGQLRAEFEAQKTPARLVRRVEDAAAGEFIVLALGPGPRASAVLGAAAPAGAESLTLAMGKAGRRPVLAACGGDARGLEYALLELADRVRYSEDALASLVSPLPVSERPANRIRSITRCFVSDVEDKPWYNDRAMWPEYLSMLATQRFNRFSLAFGIGYDFLRQISDCYLHFAYPFLLAVPGFDVRARGLADAERDSNLEMLRFIGAETEKRGLDFQLALWTHGYQWIDSPRANYVIEGLGPANHAAYCREALYRLLEAVPSIRGVTFRIHGESGVAEGAYDFWKTVFEGIVRTGRKIEIDMHAKGMDYRMIDVALATGMPVNVSPKYWAEHMGLPYHQAGIRDLEKPPRERQDQGFFALSGGSRRFLRYGYGDLLREKRRHGVLHRMWPGTERTLLWGDPAMAAAYGRVSSFCDSAGIELCEPLSFKGRKGSGLAGGRCAYADNTLSPRWDWEKFLHTYRVWGRLLYNPESSPYVWRRYLNHQLREAAPAAEQALESASRILPLVTTAHGASGANNSYWPENYANMAIVRTSKRQPYGDTPEPKKFGTVSPFDPELFSRVDDFARGLLEGAADPKYSPVEVAQWLEDFATGAERSRRQAALRATAGDVEFRRLDVDVAIQAALGRFFAAKFRAAVLYALYEQTQDRTAIGKALELYRAAQTAWTEAAEHGKVYAPDITYGYDKQLRGHWRDRLPAIAEDIEDMAGAMRDAAPHETPALTAAIRAVLAKPARPKVGCRHTPPGAFRPGEPVSIAAAFEKPVPVRLHYRHVNQGEEFVVMDMKLEAGSHSAVIPGEYARSPYPLQYYFELRAGNAAWLYPALEPPEWRQPYFVVRQA